MLSKSSSVLFSILFIVFILGVIAYLDTAELQSNDTATFLTSVAVNEDTEETIGDGDVNQSKEDPLDSLIPNLEYRLIETSLTKDGYLLETYREFEIYEDESGDILKSVPTANYEYIRYTQ